MKPSKIVLSYKHFKLKWRFKASKTSIPNEIKEISEKKYSKQGNFLVQMSFALYLTVKIAQKSNGFCYILCNRDLPHPRLYVFLV